MVEDNSSYPLGKYREYQYLRIYQNEISTGIFLEFNLNLQYLSLILMMFKIVNANNDLNLQSFLAEREKYFYYNDRIFIFGARFLSVYFTRIRKESACR